MKQKKGALAVTAALVGSIAFGGVAVAADLDETPTRNWGGTWFGFGAGYSNSAYKGDHGSTTCFSGASSSGLGQSQASCNVGCDETGGDAGVNARAEIIGGEGERAAAETSAAVAFEGANSAAGSASAFGLDPPVSTSVTVDSSPNVVIDVDGLTKSSSSEAKTDDSGVSVRSDVETDVGVLAAKTESVSFYDPASGVFGAAARSTVSLPNGTADAFALGLGGLPGSFSDGNGDFAPSIHMRMDHQTESNWVLGGELELLFPTGSDVTDTREVEVNLEFDGDVNVPLSANSAIRVDTNALASARVRLGYAMGDYLLYGTSGVAYASLEANASGSGSFAGDTASVSQSKSTHAWGGVVGGGVSAFMNDDTVVSLEGLYYMFDKTISFEEGSVKLDDAFSVMVKVSIRPN